MMWHSRTTRWPIVLAVVATVALGAPSTAAAAPPGDDNIKVSVSDILRTNPQARLIQPGVVEVQRGIAVLVPPPGGWQVDGQAQRSPDWCDYHWTCIWEARAPEFGYGLAFYYCNSPGFIVNLGAMRYPDGASVGTGAPGPKWNDRASSEANNQTPGQITTFYNWEGYWRAMGSTIAPYSHPDWSQRTGWNDVVDGIDPC